MSAAGARAQLSSGPKDPSTVINEACVVGATWFPTGNAVSSDDLYAQTSPAGSPTECLKATGYGFNIPAVAQIKGIEVFIERHTSGGNMKDSSVKLVKGGSIVGNEHADTVTVWPTSDAFATYGSSSDLWGTTWTAAEINNAGFGASISAVDSGNTASIDVIQITVHYDLCADTPSGSCRTALKSVFIVKDKGVDSPKDKMIWKWIKGQSTQQDDFGDPTVAVTGATNSLCVYANNALIAEAVVPPDATKWTALSTKGYKYLDKPGTEDGITKIIQKGSAPMVDKAKILVKGKGAALPDIAPMLALDVQVQLVNSETGLCWGATFDSGDVVKNDTAKGLFKAKAQ